MLSKNRLSLTGAASSLEVRTMLDGEGEILLSSDLQEPIPATAADLPDAVKFNEKDNEELQELFDVSEASQTENAKQFTTDDNGLVSTFNAQDLTAEQLAAAKADPNGPPVFEVTQSSRTSFSATGKIPDSIVAHSHPTQFVGGPDGTQDGVGRGFIGDTNREDALTQGFDVNSANAASSPHSPSDSAFSTISGDPTLVQAGENLTSVFIPTMEGAENAKNTDADQFLERVNAAGRTGQQNAAVAATSQDPQNQVQGTRNLTSQEFQVVLNSGSSAAADAAQGGLFVGESGADADGGTTAVRQRGNSPVEDVSSGTATREGSLKDLNQTNEANRALALEEQNKRNADLAEQTGASQS